MTNAPNHYHTFLLRLWPEPAEAGCRVTLHDLRAAQRLGFASLEQLFAYLLQLAEASQPGEPGSEPPQRPD